MAKETIRSDLKKLENLFGIPEEGIKTGVILGGPSGYEFCRGGEKTGYSLGGKTGNNIVSREGEVIGIVAMTPTRGIFTSKGEETNYQLGGPTGRLVLYVKRSSESKP